MTQYSIELKIKSSHLAAQTNDKYIVNMFEGLSEAQLKLCSDWFANCPVNREWKTLMPKKKKKTNKKTNVPTIALGQHQAR